MDRSLGSKIDKRCGPQFGPDKKCKEERAPLKEVRRGRTALPFRWNNDNSKRCFVVVDVNL